MRKNDRILPSQIAGPRIAAWAQVTVAAGAATLNAGFNVSAVGLVTTGQVDVVLRPALATQSVCIATSRQNQFRVMNVHRAGASTATSHITVFSWDDTGSAANANFDFVAYVGG